MHPLWRGKLGFLKPSPRGLWPPTQTAPGPVASWGSERNRVPGARQMLPQNHKEIVEFSGVQITKAMLDFIKRQTSAKRDSCAYCTQRHNPRHTAYKWRTKLSHSQASYISQKCQRSDEVLGYLSLTTELDRNDLTLPSRKIIDTRKELLFNDKF